MSFWDNVKKFTQPYDDDYDDYDDEELEDYEEPAEEPAPRARRTSPFANTTSAPAPAAAAEPPVSAPVSSNSSFGGQVLNMNSSGKQEVVLFHAKAFDDAAKAADELCKRKAVILNMENVDKALTRRVVDFLSGSVYALDGRVKKVAQSTYLFCPRNMDVVGDLENLRSEADSYI